MSEDRKLFYLSRRQRVVISLLLGSLVVALLFVACLAVVESRFANLLQPAVELLKVALTGAAAWCLVILYASANSPERIEAETNRFFSHDLMRAFGRQGFDATAHGRGREVALLKNKGGVALVCATDNGSDAVLLWHHLNVQRITTVFLLNPELAGSYEVAFQASLKGLASRGLSVETFGVQTHDADGALPENHTYLELFVSMDLPQDFLFNAASRYATASSLAGDTRSFLVETGRSSRSKASSPQT